MGTQCIIAGKCVKWLYGAQAAIQRSLRLMIMQFE